MTASTQKESTTPPGKVSPFCEQLILARHDLDSNDRRHLTFTQLTTPVHDNMLPIAFEQRRLTTDVISEHNMSHETTMPISRIFDRFRAMNITRIQPVFTANTRSLLFMEGHARPTVSVQTISIDENMAISSVPATSIMDDNVVRIPSASGIIASSGANHVTRADIPRTTVFTRQMTTRNHAYLCLDAEHRIVRPEIISFPSTDSNVRHSHHSQAEHLRNRIDSACNKVLPSNSHKKVNPPPFSTACSRQASSTHSPLLEDNAPAYMDLGDYDQQCHHCGCLFWYAERLKGGRYNNHAEYIYDVEEGRYTCLLLTGTSRDPKSCSHASGTCSSTPGQQVALSSDPEMILKFRNHRGEGTKVSMNAYYKYLLHPQKKEFGLIFKCGRLFQQADVVCRVFKHKVKEFVRFLIEVKTFGHVIAVLYIIEFQKRDLLQDTRGYKVVSELMMHGPCGDAKLSASCVQNGSCNKNFQKRLDNYNVVPYNRTPCLAFEARINVEYCGWSMLNKYMFKYIPKGPDCILAKISRSIGEASTSTDERRPPLPNDSKTWQQRQTRIKKSLGGLTYVHPSSGELFYFRMLLCHQKGCKSPVDVRTVKGEILPTYRAVSEALGFLDPPKLWNKYWETMCDDIPKKSIRSNENSKLPYFRMQTPPEHLLKDLNNKLLMEEKNYNRKLLMQDDVQFIPNLNCDQRKIYDMIINALASSGITSLLLSVGRTAHSRFKLPLELTDESLCHVKKNTQLGKLLVETNLIIWDEAKINDRRCFETLDRSLTDLMNAPSWIFGGKTAILGEIFAKWLLDVENGEIGYPDEEDNEDSRWIIVLEEYCVPSNAAGMSHLIDFIYDDITFKTPTAVDLRSTYLSKDEALPIGRETSETEMLYPMEYLNTINFPSFLPHELQLKVGSPIMLLRNVKLSGGLCNDTRMIVRSLMLSGTMSENTIASLKVGQENRILEARVYRKWISKSIQGTKEIAFCCILINREKNAIQANMDVNNTDYFNPLLRGGTIYKFFNFICEDTKPYLQTLENKII
uniref:ATP-dependent DNA helicase n=1 Tax=Tanacetum cinerariifolium TaxID=118510 RepID=A0A6L2LIC3_TANCI|nr:DNA helicase [Tanacetum cinerariifolium]